LFSSLGGRRKWRRGKIPFLIWGEGQGEGEKRGIF
jgi:hypothetical protein